MKINEGFELREMCGEHIIIATGMANIDFSKVISAMEKAEVPQELVDVVKDAVDMLQYYMS